MLLDHHENPLAPLRWVYLETQGTALLVVAGVVVAFGEEAIVAPQLVPCWQSLSHT
jgi:hypothetical protein